MTCYPGLILLPQLGCIAFCSTIAEAVPLGQIDDNFLIIMAQVLQAASYFNTSYHMPSKPTHNSAR